MRLRSCFIYAFSGYHTYHIFKTQLITETGSHVDLSCLYYVFFKCLLVLYQTEVTDYKPQQILDIPWNTPAMISQPARPLINAKSNAAQRNVWKYATAGPYYCWHSKQENMPVWLDLWAKACVCEWSEGRNYYHMEQ